MKKGDIVQGYVERVEFPNKGIVRIVEEDRNVVVKNTIPGQKLEIQINKLRKGKAEGRVVSILENSPIETENACPHFGACGGCVYQSVDYKEQLKIKEAQIKGLLDSVIDYEYDFQGILESPVHNGYRNKMEYSFGDEIKDGPMALGMHKRGSFHDIITVDGCRIVDEDYNKILRCVLDFASATGLPFLHKMRHEGFFRHLLVRKAVKTKEILVDVVTTTQYSCDFKELVADLRKLELDGRIVGILHTDNDSLADIVQNDRTEVLYGQDFFYEELLDLRFKITPFSFFQTNFLGAEVLYSKAREYIGDVDGKVVFDLYSGTGTIAQIIAPVAKKVVGVEIVKEAVEAAKINAELNGLTNCEFIAGDVLKVIDDIEEKPDLIILDPPRDGIHPKALQKIIDYGVDYMVYVSCKPTSLVRDLEVLKEQGYRVVKGCAVDMFPGTGHVETVCLLSRKAPV
ncbi:MAG: 23S rRNA (uracil(1939)-C(5))-methyltransferase RlmD [Thermoflexaceae bacterium]|nr:23S rRNA (uracil(1939)-C(5))-methyltransferase RlmD [Thermoflexaceae bacterium]